MGSLYAQSFTIFSNRYSCFFNNKNVRMPELEIWDSDLVLVGLSFEVPNKTHHSSSSKEFFWVPLHLSPHRGWPGSFWSVASSSLIFSSTNTAGLDSWLQSLHPVEWFVPWLQGRCCITPGLCSWMRCSAAQCCTEKTLLVCLLVHVSLLCNQRWKDQSECTGWDSVSTGGKILGKVTLVSLSDFV